MSKEINSIVYGIAPWSDDLFQASSDFERGRTDGEHLKRVFADDDFLYESTILAAGIDYAGRSKGPDQLDYLRGIAQVSSGLGSDVAVAPVTRWFDRNTFYRQPQITEDFAFDPSADSQLLERERHRELTGDKKRIVTLLSPIAFSELVDQTGELTKEEIEQKVDDVYSDILDYFARTNKADQILLHDPYSAYERRSPEENQAIIDRLSRFVLRNKLDIGVYFSNGNASGIITAAISNGLAVNRVGCDVTETPVDELPSLDGREFIAGVINADNTLEQTDEDVIQIVDDLVEKTKVETLYITHTTDLEHVPYEHALQKIRQLGRVTRLLKGANK